MDRFTRFKILRALWARARALMAWLHGPQQHQLRQRYHYWQQVNMAERHIRDGVVRGREDPDAYQRPLGSAGQDAGRLAWPPPPRDDRQAGLHEARQQWEDQARRQAESQRQAEQFQQAAQQQRNGFHPHPRR